MEYEIILPNAQNVCVKLEKRPGHLPKGAELLEALFENLGLRKGEEQYFGLMYCDKEDGRMDWLENTDVLKNLRMSKSSRFHFSVRYYPEHPELVLHDEKTQSLFRVQIKEKLLKGEWACEVETHAFLDGLVVQAECGSFNPNEHKPGYLKSLKGLEICAPNRMNSEKDISENAYLKRVSYHHKRNLGRSQNDADVMYLHKAREIPLYGFIVHKAVDANDNELFIGLREQSIAIFDGQQVDNCSPVLIQTEFHWNTLKYCTHAKCKVKIGVTIQSEVVTEIVWRVKSKNCYRGAERLCNDIKAFRAMYASRDEADFCSSKKEIKRVRSFSRQTSRPRVSRLNSVTTVLRNSLKRKKKKERKEISPFPSVLNQSNQEGENEHDRSNVVLVQSASS